MLYRCIETGWSVYLTHDVESSPIGYLLKGDIFYELETAECETDSAAVTFSKVLLANGVVGYVWLSVRPYGWAWEAVTDAV